LSVRKVVLLVICSCLLLLVGIRLLDDNTISNDFTFEKNPAKEIELKKNKTYTVRVNSKTFPTGFYDITGIDNKETFAGNDNLNRKDVIRNKAYYDTNKIKSPRKSSVHLEPSKEKFLPVKADGSVQLVNTYGHFFIPVSMSGKYEFKIIGMGKVFCQIQDINKTTGFINNVLDDFVFDQSTKYVKELKSDMILSFFKNSGDKDVTILLVPIL
jgi:hypothetical protein